MTGILSDDEVAGWAGRIVEARRAGRPLAATITDAAAVTMDDAYRIQEAVTGARLAVGERLAGWKLGYTTAAMRQQMGVDEPNFGPLTDAMLLRAGDMAGPGLLQPRVEPEIGFRLDRPLAPPISLEDVLAAAVPFAALEVVDSVWVGYRFRIEDNTADGSSAARMVAGTDLPPEGLDHVGVVLSRNGEPCGTGTGAAALGHPGAAVVWLAGELARRGRRLEPGQVVITGGLTAAVPLERGDVVEAIFSRPEPTASPPVAVSVRR